MYLGDNLTENLTIWTLQKRFLANGHHYTMNYCQYKEISLSELPITTR